MTLAQDIRFGLRVLAKSPGFTLVAVFALALGIGVNSMMFTIYNAALVKSLPFENPQQVLHIHNRNLIEQRNNMGTSYRDLLEYRQQAHSFKEVASFIETEYSISDDRSVPDQIDAVRQTSNTFSMLGLKPIMGRDFRQDDERPEADPVVIISYALWQTRYGSDSSIIGKDVKLAGRHFTIIGVMPQGMQFPEANQLWIPITSDLNEAQRTAFLYRTIGRLRDSVTPDQAQTELRGIAARIADAYPATNKGVEPVAQRYIDFEVSPGEKLILKTLLGAVSFVLLIACANVANLMLSRAVHRSRETSIRIALGASRWRVVRQLLSESVLLSLAGGVLGLVFALAGVHIFAMAVQGIVPYWFDWSMDRVAFAYLLLVCVVTGIVFGLAPALQLSRTDVNSGLKETGRGTNGGIRSRRLTGALVVAEISLTLVLMVGAALLVRSLFNMQAINVGVGLDNLIGMTLSLPATKYPMPDDRLRFKDRLYERLAAIPDLETFTIASSIPAGGAGRSPLTLEGRDLTDRNGHAPAVLSLTIAPEYFRALGLNVLRGREFNSTDGAPGAEAAIVNPRFAAEYFAGEEPLGKRLHLGDGKWATVVGIAPKIAQVRLEDEPEAAVYVPYRQVPLVYYNIITRVRGNHDVAVRKLREQIGSLDPDLPVFNIRTVQEEIDNRTVRTRILGTMFSVFALIGLILASVGIYAVTAYSANQRTQEIGVRVALGAGNRDVLWLVLRSGLAQLFVALPIGLVLAALVTRVLTIVLFKVTALDLMTFIAIPILLALIVIAACLLPALRAARLNPVEALRTE